MASPGAGKALVPATSRHHFSGFPANAAGERCPAGAESGRAATDVALDNGYESLSGFGYTYKRLTGAAPTRQAVIVIHRFTTTLGPMFVCATERGVCLLEFTDRRMLETEFRDIQRLFNARIVTGENSHTRQTVKEIGEYFAGTRRQFDLA